MFNIKIAGLTVQIDNQYKYLQLLCKNYMTNEKQVDIIASATEEEIRVQQIVNGGPWPPGYCESLCVYRNLCNQLPAFDAFLIHGAAIAVDGEVYLFLARSGVGKSTHVRLWMEAFGGRAQVVNGDKPILRRFDGRWFVCGTPYQGKEDWGTNTMLPLKALCFLERGEDNQISAISESEMNGRLMWQLLLPAEESQCTMLFDLLNDLIEKIPSYLLQCNRARSAPWVAYRGMQQSETGRNTFT